MVRYRRIRLLARVKVGWWEMTALLLVMLVTLYIGFLWGIQFAGGDDD